MGELQDFSESRNVAPKILVTWPRKVRETKEKTGCFNIAHRYMTDYRPQTKLWENNVTGICLFIVRLGNIKYIMG